MEEMVDVVDDNLKVLGVVSKKEAIDKNLKHKGAAVIVRNSKGEFYIQKRKKDRKVYPSKWGLGAGGSLHSGESFLDGAKRELKEELGIISKLKFLLDFDYSNPVIDYNAKIYTTIYDGKIKLDKKEGEKGKWVSLKELKTFFKRKLFTPDTNLLIKRYLKDAPN